MYAQQRHYSEQIPIKSKNPEIDLLGLVASKQENKSDEKSANNKVEDIKQIPEKEESKLSKDSSQQLKLATGENDGTAPNESEYN